MKNLIKNPSFEFLSNENGTVTIFDTDMTIIYNVDNTGKTILSFLDEAISENSLESCLSKVFSNINFDELHDFLHTLCRRKSEYPLYRPPHSSRCRRRWHSAESAE